MNSNHIHQKLRQYDLAYWVIGHLA